VISGNAGGPGLGNILGLTGRSSAGCGGHQCGQNERDQREDDDDAVKHLRVHGAGDLVAVRDDWQRLEIGG